MDTFYQRRDWREWRERGSAAELVNYRLENRILLFCCFSTRRKEMSEQTRHATPNLLISIHILWLLISTPLPILPSSSHQKPLIYTGRIYRYSGGEPSLPVQRFLQLSHFWTSLRFLRGFHRCYFLPTTSSHQHFLIKLFNVCWRLEKMLRLVFKGSREIWKLLRDRFLDTLILFLESLLRNSLDVWRKQTRMIDHRGV